MIAVASSADINTFCVTISDQDMHMKLIKCVLCLTALLYDFIHVMLYHATVC